MSVLAALGCRIDDVLNPIVVKELRQAVRSRFVSGALIFLLVIQFAVVGLYVMFTAGDSASFSEGRNINLALSGVLFFSCVIFVPLYAGVRLAWERSETQMDLMYISTISPGAIVRGKLFCAAAVTVLIYSACMPFMTFTYLLRGVDLPSVFIMLAIEFVEVLLAAQVTIFVACVPASRFFKVLLGLATFAGLWIYAGIAVEMLGAAMLVRGGTIYSGWPFWAGFLTSLALAAMLMGYLYFLSVAMISPPSADRMRPVRLYLMALWLASGVLALVWTWSGSRWEPWEAWAWFWSFALAFYTPIVLSEREAWGPRIRAGIPRSRLARAVALLLTTGSAGGIFWVLFMAFLTWAICSLVISAMKTYGFVPGDPTPGGALIIAGIVLYGAAYGLTATLIRKLLGLAKLHIPAGLTWLIAYMLVVFGSLGPYVLRFFLYFNEGASVIFQDRAWIVTSPIMITQDTFRELRLIVAAFWACGAFVLTAPWLLRQIASFRRLEPAAAAPAAGPPPSS
jgi:hypothetical protein